jgi:hypothetical protein
MLDTVLVQETQRASVVETRLAHVQFRTPAWVKPVTPQCVALEAQRQSLELVKVLSVMKTEGGRLGMYSLNANGSYDIGPMQVNSVHLPELAKLYGITTNSASQLLAFDGCFNVAVATWMLRQKTNEAGGDFWYGIGRYHSATTSYSNQYILRVHAVMVGLVRDEAKAAARVSAPASEIQSVAMQGVRKGF